MVGLRNDKDDFFLMTEPRSRDIFPDLEKTSYRDALGSDVLSASDSIMKSSKKSFVVFVLGGLSYSEYLTFKKIEQKYNKKMLIVSTNVLNKKYFQKFIEDI
jgi:hypothetical protein